MNLPWLDAHTHRQSTSPSRCFTLTCSPGPRNSLCKGIHPWDIDDSWKSRFKNLKNSISIQRPLGIGETGLDKVKGPDLAIQEEVFLAHLNLANLHGLPVIIHQVRCVDRILFFHKHEARTPWMIHDYQGNEQTALMLIKKGIFLSFSPRILRPANPIPEFISNLDRNQIFLETDDFDYEISNLYEEVATMLGWAPEALNEHCWKNLENFLEVERASILA